METNIPVLWRQPEPPRELTATYGRIMSFVPRKRRSYHERLTSNLEILSVRLVAIVSVDLSIDVLF